jgi:hypothetical protein
MVESWEFSWGVKREFKATTGNDLFLQEGAMDMKDEQFSVPG